MQWRGCECVILLYESWFRTAEIKLQYVQVAERAGAGICIRTPHGVGVMQGWVQCEQGKIVLHWNEQHEMMDNAV